jgi:glyoxylase-like metal-dependent hydrolase (beta-lactamase superfamily II)
MKKIIIPFLASILFSNVSFSQIPENTTFVDSVAASIGNIKEELVKVKENLYVIQPYGLAGNTGVFISDDGVILIDDQWAMLADRIKELIATITDKEIKTIINTHYHVDHTHGNIIFGKENIPIISQENAFERMSERQVIPTFLNIVQEAYPKNVRPSMTFLEKFVLHEEEERIELIHLKNAHTDGDLIVHFVNANVYHTGDIFFAVGLPHIDERAGGDIYGLLQAVDYMIQNSNDETVFIPGHGELSTKKEVSAYRNLLAQLLSLVEASEKKGMEIADIIKKVKLNMNYEHISGDDFIRQVHRSVLKKLND